MSIRGSLDPQTGTELESNILSGNEKNITETEFSVGETIQNIVAIVKRGRWFVLSAACLVPIATVVVALKLPDRYVSQATLLLVQPQISQRFVESDSTTSIPAAVQTAKLEVLSHGRLLAMIEELGLYPTERLKLAPEVLVDRMRKDIDIQPLEAGIGRETTAFTISFSAPTPHLAQDVTSRIASLFIEQNLKSRGEQAANTTKFLSDQLDTAKQRLVDQEQHLQAFRSSNMGELPEQQQMNLTALADLRERLENVTSSIQQVEQQQTTLELSLEDRLTALGKDRDALLMRFTSRYPEVVKKDHEIERVKAALNRMKTTGSGIARPPNPDSSSDAVLEGLLRQAETNGLQLSGLLRQQEKLKGEIEQYQRRINLTPLREQQLAAIQRDYNLFKQDYSDLLNKKLQSQLAASVEENQEGQHFRLVDPPNLPLKPSSPSRLRISLAGVAAGLVLGLALAFAMSLRDTSFRTEKAVVRAFSVPLAIAVPLVRTPGERRTRNLRIAFECLTAGVMILAMCAAELYVFRHR